MSKIPNPNGDNTPLHADNRVMATGFLAAMGVKKARYPYGVAIASVIAATAMRLAFLSALGMGAPYILFYPTVMFVALYGGFRPGMLATVLSALVADYFWIVPTGQFLPVHLNDWLGLAIFIMSGAMISGLTGTMRRSQTRAHEAESVAKIAVARQRDLEALRESEERLRSLAENVPCVLMRFDRQLRVVYLSPQSNQYNPTKVEQMLGRTNREVGMPEELCDRWDAAIEQVFSTGTPEEMEFDFAGPSGMRTFALKFAPEFGPDHQVQYVLGVSTDITERKQLLAEIQQRAAELEILVENTDAHLVLLDRNFTFLMVNSTYAEGSGYSRSELIGNNHFALFPHAENQAIFEQVRDTGVPYRVTEKPFEFAGQPERGITYWNWILTPIRNRDGEVERLLLSLVDVTQQVRARQQIETLAEENKRRTTELDGILDSLADGVVIYSTSGEVVRRNVMAVRLLRYTPEIETMSVEERVAFLRYEREDGTPYLLHETPLARSLRGETVYGEVVAMHFPDETRWVTLNTAPIHTSDGQMLGVVASFTDITSLHELQEQQKVLIHLVSHDLRAPVTIIQGYADILADGLTEGQPDSPLKTATQAIRRGIRRLNVMIQDLVDSARADGGQLALECQPIALGEYLPEMLERTAPALEVARIGVDILAGLPPILADSDRLERIFTNLLSNALKYSDPGTPVLVGARRQDNEVIISVTDQGRGIPPEVIPHLFGRFYRAPGERKAEGIGLGLYITRLLVEAHGGRVWVKSEEGKGSTFFFSLPAGQERELQA